MTKTLSLLAAVGVLLAASVGVAAEPPRTVETFTVDAVSPHGFCKAGPAFVPLARAIDLTDPKTAAVSVEAEEADESLGLRTAKDEKDSCTYAADFRLLRFGYMARERRAAVLWGRVRQDDQPRCIVLSGHQWSSERSYQERKLDPKEEHKKNAGQWRWERLRPFGVEPGLHALEAKWSWPGTPDVDKFAVVFGEGPPDEARPARTAVSGGDVESAAFRHSAAVELVDATVVGPGADRGSVVEASVDDGKTWSAARNVPLASGAFRLRARLAAPAAPGAGVRHFRAQVALRPGGYLKLENAAARLDFDVGRHGVVRIAMPSRGLVLASPAEAPAFFTLELKKRGQPWPEPRYVLDCRKDGKLVAAGLTAVDGDPAASFEYDLADGKITAAVVVRLARNGETTWTLSLDNRSEWDILTYTFPRLAGLKVSDSGYDDRWANTNFYGPWPAGFQPEDRPYPGWGALGWTDLYDDEAGLSFQVRDVLEGQTNFLLRPDAAHGPEACTLEAVKEHCVASGEKRTWTYVVLPHAGDWHAAADRYREWFRASFGTADHFPDWARDSNGWIEANCALSDAWFKWPMLLDTFEEGRRMGIAHVQVWGQFGSSTCGSFWWPSPRYGSVAEFAAANAEIRRRGGHVGYYLMYHLDNRYNHIDDKTYDGYLPRDRYPAGVPLLAVDEFRKAALVTDPAGRPTAWPETPEDLTRLRQALAGLLAEKKTTVWADGAQVTMNPMEKVWQDYVVRWTDGLYVGKWGCDTAYQDVLGCGTVGRSFDLRRGDHGQVYTRANMDLAQRLSEEGRKLDPAFALSAEGKSELVTRWAMGMTSSSHYGWIQLDAHRYTHPDHILVMGGANGGWNQPLKNAQLAFLYGARNDLILSKDVDRVREVVTLRQAFLRYVTRAVYRDTVGLKFVGDGIEARRFDRTEGDARAVLVCAINPSESAGGSLEVDLGAFGQDRPGAFWFLADGTASRADLKRSGAWASAPVPAQHVAALLLVSRPPKGEDILAKLTPWFDPGEAHVRYWVANLSPSPRRLTATLDGPGLRRQEKALEVPAHGLVTDLVAWPSAGAADGGDVHLTVDGRRLAMGYLYPLVEDGSFEKREVPKEGQPFDGKSFLGFGPKQGWQGHGVRLNLRASSRYRVSVMGRRTGAGGNMFALVRMNSRAKGWQHVGLNFPKDVFNQWVKLEAEAAAPADMTEADVYLYNSDSRETVDYDLLRVEMLAGAGAR